MIAVVGLLVGLALGVPQRDGGDADDPGDVGLGNTVAGHGLDLPARGWVWLVGATTHVRRPA